MSPGGTLSDKVWERERARAREERISTERGMEFLAARPLALKPVDSPERTDPGFRWRREEP